MILYLDNDNILWARGVYVISLVTGLPVYLDGSSTLEVTLLDSNGAEVGGETTWPIAFTYITGSQGVFLALLRNELELIPHQEVTAHVTIDAGSDQRGVWDGRLLVMSRTF